MPAILNTATRGFQRTPSAAKHTEVCFLTSAESEAQIVMPGESLTKTLLH